MATVVEKNKKYTYEDVLENNIYQLYKAYRKDDTLESASLKAL